MSEHRFADETATMVVLHSMISDMRHGLNWLAAGLLGVSFYDVLTALSDAFGGSWWGAGIHAALALWFGWSSFDTNRRARKYRPATRKAGR